MTARKKTAPKRKPTPVKVTAAMKRAGAAVLAGSRNMKAEDRAAAIYQAMVGKASTAQTPTFAPVPIRSLHEIYLPPDMPPLGEDIAWKTTPVGTLATPRGFLGAAFIPA